MLNFRYTALFCFLFNLHGIAANAAEATYDELIQESLQLRNSGDFPAAEETLKRTLPLAAETNEVDFLLAMVIAFQERYTEAIEIVDKSLERYPDDIQLILAKARILSYSGAYNESIEIADSVLAIDPNNYEALSLKARVYYYQRRFAEARRQFNLVIAQDPSSLDAVIGLYDTELAAGNDLIAEDVLERAEVLAPTHIDVTTRRQSSNQSNIVHNQIAASFKQSELDQAGFQNWYDRTLEYRYRASLDKQVYLRSEQAKRFGFEDTLFEVGGLYGKKNTTFELAYARTPDSEVLPEQRIRVGGNFLLMLASENSGSTTLGASFTQSRYSNGDVQWLKLDFTHYLLNLNAWLTPGVGIVKDEFGEKTVGWNIGAHWQIDEQVLVGYNYTDAPETELNLTTQTNAHHLYTRIELGEGTSIRFDFSRNVRKNSYSRESIALSLQYQF